MKSLLVSLGFALVAISIAHADPSGLTGTWTAKVADKRPEMLQLSLEIRPDTEHGHLIDRSDLEGLTAAQVSSTTGAPVRFELRRDAGTITFEGAFRDGRGAGPFTFASDPEYERKLRQLGVSLEAKGSEHEREMLNLALLDVSIEFVRSMRAIGYDVAIDKYVAFRIFHVDLEYVRQMGKAGFDHLSADKLVETRIHGATPDYIREMRASGNDLTLDQYIESRIFQITPEFAAAMSRAGYRNLDRDMLVQFRIHGVTPEFVRELRELGYTRIPASKLVEMRIHGVTPEFVRRLAVAGHRNVPIDKMVQMKIFGINPEMVKSMDESEWH